MAMIRQAIFGFPFLKEQRFHLRGRQLVRLGCNAAQRTGQIRRLVLEAIEKV